MNTGPTKVNRILAVTAAVGMGLGAAMSAGAAQGDVVVRGRATLLDFSNGQNGMPAVVKADTRWIPEVDLSYYLTDAWSAELVLTWPQKVDIAVNGGDAGSVRALPPTLLAQYHFSGLGAFTPYLGAGVNLTLFSKRSLLGGTASTDKSSVGFAVQAGADYDLGNQWSLNLDLKYIDMDTGVHVGGNRIGTLDLNPMVASVGFGYRF
jgi:outer membrane protein